MSRSPNGCWQTSVVSAPCAHCHVISDIVHVNPPERGQTVFYYSAHCVLCNSTKEGNVAPPHLPKVAVDG